MKKLLIILLILVSGISNNTFSQTTYTVPSKSINLNSIDSKKLKKFRIKKDEFKGITYIKTYYSKWLDKYAYIVITEDEMYLRLKTKYIGDDWIFMKEGIVLYDNKKTTFSLGEPKTKILTNQVRETSDIKVDDELFNALKEFSISQGEVKLRLSGKRVKDTKYSKKEKKNLVSIIQLFNEISKSST